MVDRKKLALPLFLVTTLILLLLASLRQSSNNRKTQPLAQPILGGSEHMRQGPWPECLQLSGSDCVARIRANTDSSVRDIVIVHENAVVTMDFRVDRVRVFVDDSGVVTKIPKRG